MKVKYIIFLFCILLTLGLVNASFYIDTEEQPSWIVEKVDSNFFTYIGDKNSQKTIICELSYTATKSKDLKEDRTFEKADKDTDKIKIKEPKLKPIEIKSKDSRLDKDYYGYCYEVKDNTKYVKFGDKSTVVVYQEQPQVIYETGFNKITNRLLKWNGEEYVQSPQDIFIDDSNKNNLKFGAIDYNPLTNTYGKYRYEWESDKEIFYDTEKDMYYVLDGISTNYANILYSSYFENRLYFDMDDICSYNYSHCKISHHKNGLAVNFYAKVVNNSVFIDPAYVISFNSNSIKQGYFNSTTINNLGINLEEYFNGSMDYNSENLISHWKLNDGENATTFVDSYGIFNGSCSTEYCPTYISEGIIEGAMYFNSSRRDRIIISDSGGDLTNDYQTVTAWVYMEDISSDIHYAIIEKLPHDQVWELFLSYFNTEGKKLFMRGGAVNPSLTGNTLLRPNKWYFISAVWDGTTGRLYIDGKLDATGSIAIAKTSGTGNVLIGSTYRLNNYNDGLNGKLSDIVIWDRALSSDEIEDLYINSRYDKGSYNSFVFISTANDTDNPVTFSDTSSNVFGQVYEGGCKGSAYCWDLYDESSCSQAGEDCWWEGYCDWDWWSGNDCYSMYYGDEVGCSGNPYCYWDDYYGECYDNYDCYSAMDEMECMSMPSCYWSGYCNGDWQNDYQYSCEVWDEYSCYNYWGCYLETGEYLANGSEHDIKVFAYKNTECGTVYNEIPAQSNIVEDYDDSGYYGFQWSWDSVTGADGYKVLKSYTGNMDYDYYIDTSDTSILDLSPSYWSSGNNTEPTVCYLDNMGYFANWGIELDTATSDGEWNTKELCDNDAGCIAYFPLDNNTLDYKNDNELNCKFAGGDGSAENPYQISSWTQLNEVKQSVSSHYVMIRDLLPTDSDYPGIGDNFDFINSFNGVFDGQNHSIVGIIANSGIFGSLGSNPTINNFMVVNGTIKASSGYVGIITQMRSIATISNVHNRNTNIIAGVGSSAFAGGILGLISTSTPSQGTSMIVTDCSNSGDVYSTNHGGGIVGYFNNGRVYNSFSTGSWTGSSVKGGIIGTYSGSNTAQTNNGWWTGSSGYISAIGSPSGSVTYQTANIADFYNSSYGFYSNWDLSGFSFTGSDLPYLISVEQESTNDSCVFRKGISDYSVESFVSVYSPETVSVSYWHKGTDNLWNHVVISNGTKYVNGVLGTPAYEVYKLNNTYHFGKISINSNYNGYIDEILLFNRTLSSTDVKNIFTAGLSQKANTSIELMYRYATEYNLTDTNLKGFWSFNFDRGTTVYDEMGNHNGISNLVSSSQSLSDEQYGVVGKGYSFNGASNRIDVPNHANLNPQNELTISVWVYPTNLASTRRGGIVSKRTTNTNTGYILTTESTNLKFETRNATDLRVLTIPDLELNKWQHIGATYNKNTGMKVYINGNLVGELETTGELHNSNNQNLVIGKEATGTNQYFSGYIDEVKLYNRELTDTEVLNLYELNNLHISDWTDWTEDNTDIGTFMQFKAFLETNDTERTPYIISQEVSYTEILPFEIVNSYTENMFAISQFIEVDGTSFTLAGEPYKFMGVNAYYLSDYAMNLTYDDDGNEINNSRQYVLEILDKAQSLNINVLRTWANMQGGGCDGYVGHPNCWDREPYGGRWNLFEVGEPGNYSEEMFEALDWVIYEASKRDIRILPVFINNWNEYGGMRWYVQQSPTTSKTHSNISDNGDDRWWTFHDQFYSDVNTKQYYKNYIAHLVNRTNTYSGLKYSDDPAIFGWLLANEPRAKTQGANPALMKAWATEMTAYVKSLDSNHIVGMGVEGIGLDESWGDGYNFIAIHNGTGVDFATFAMHSDQWNWFVTRSEDSTGWLTGGIANNRTIDFWTKGTGYTINNRYTSGNVANWIPRLPRRTYPNWATFNTQLANNLGLPVLMQEVTYPTAVESRLRDKYYTQAVNSFFNEGGDGFLLWNFNHDNYYYSTADSSYAGKMDDGYSFYFSTDAFLKNKSQSVVDSFNFALTNNTGNTSWITLLNNNLITFYYEVDFNEDSIDYCSLYINTTNSTSNTGWYLDQTNYTINNGANSFVKYFDEDDVYSYWYIECCNDVRCQYTEIDYISTPPIIRLRSPAKDVILNYTNIELDYTVESGLIVTECSLYINGELNQTNNNITTSSIIDNSFFINVSIVPNKYNWQIRCTDMSDNTRYSDIYSFIYNTGEMDINLTAPINNLMTTTSTHNYTVNITSAAPIYKIELFMNYIVYHTYLPSTTLYELEYGYELYMDDNEYDWYYKITDLYGAEGYSNVRSINIDANAPLIDYISPTELNNSVKAQDFIQISLSIDELNFVNMTYYLYNGSSLINTTTYYTETSNIQFNNLSEGVYYYYVDIYDIMNQTNQTGLRTIYLDYAPEYSNIINPTDGEYEDNPYCFSIEWDDNLDVNSYLVLDSEYYVMSTEICLNLSVGYYEYYYYANNTLGSNNQTELYNFTIEKSVPNLGLTSSSGWNINSSIHSTIEGVNCPNELTCNLYLDNVLISNPYYDLFPQGDYVFVYNTTGNVNYTSSSITYTLKSRVSSIDEPGSFTPSNKLHRGVNASTATEVYWIDNNGNIYLYGNIEIEGCIIYNGGTLGSCK